MVECQYTKWYIICTSSYETYPHKKPKIIILAILANFIFLSQSIVCGFSFIEDRIQVKKKVSNSHFLLMMNFQNKNLAFRFKVLAFLLLVQISRDNHVLGTFGYISKTFCHTHYFLASNLWSTTFPITPPYWISMYYRLQSIKQQNRNTLLCPLIISQMLWGTVKEQSCELPKNL